MLAASRGDREQAQALCDRRAAGGDGARRGLGARHGRRLTALLYNGHGRYGEALAAARRACEHEDVIAYGASLVELIEAAVRSGRPDEAAAALERLERAHAGERHRMGARDRGALPRAA